MSLLLADAGLARGPLACEACVAWAAPGPRLGPSALLALARGSALLGLRGVVGAWLALAPAGAGSFDGRPRGSGANARVRFAASGTCTALAELDALAVDPRVPRGTSQQSLLGASVHGLMPLGARPLAGDALLGVRAGVEAERLGGVASISVLAKSDLFLGGVS